jgi:potassium-transporting ATPase potassium-binding subunit
VAAIVVYTPLLFVLTPPLGAWMNRVYTRPTSGLLEGFIYRMIRVNPEAEQSWRRYASSVLWFSAASMVFIYLLFRLQHLLPLNPQGLASVKPFVSFNTAASYTTNTNWQTYGGETTMSNLSQMLALTFQNFVSAAVGMAVLVAMIRGFTRSESEEIGNFWRDTVRGVVYILLPLSAIVAVILIGQGVVQTLGEWASAKGIQGFTQLMARGPTGSQVAIKQLGTNGGGFFTVNSAHPFENPTPLTNFVQSLSILWIPAALTYTFGKMVGNARQGWALFAAMWILMVAGLAITVPGERRATPAVQAAGILASSPNLEGKEVRIGTDQSSLWAVVTTAAHHPSSEGVG